jgi:hypothetical protein
MELEILYYPSVRGRLAQLQLEAVGDFLVLPRGFTDGSPDNLFHESSSLTLAKLWKSQGLDVCIVQPADRRLRVIQENDLTWVGPAIFIGGMLFSQNPAAVDIALNVLSDYVSRFFMGRTKSGRARLDIIDEKPSGECRRIHYDGPAEGLEEVRKCINSLRNS